jgi:peptide chain release factor 3
MDEVEKSLDCNADKFPCGMGYDFQGIYNIWEKKH